MKSTIISVIIAVVFIGGALILATRSPGAASVNNVSIENGEQIVQIIAKGGYSPTLTSAKANMPTILRMKTNGSFDCSSALRIPSIGYQTNLPPSGSTDIELPSQKTGTSIQGVCAMGMYSFKVAFE